MPKDNQVESREVSGDERLAYWLLLAALPAVSAAEHRRVFISPRTPDLLFDQTHIKNKAK